MTGLFTWLLNSVQDFSGGFQRVLQNMKPISGILKRQTVMCTAGRLSAAGETVYFLLQTQPLERSGLFYHVVSTENLLLLLIAGFTLWYGLRYFAELRSRLLFGVFLCSS